MKRKRQDAIMWAYQYAGALLIADDDQAEPDVVPLLDVLWALSVGEIPKVKWPACPPSRREKVKAERKRRGTLASAKEKA